MILWYHVVRHCVIIGLEICQDHAAKEKALQTMSSMSSAQIVSAGSAIHNKMPPALVGPLALHASTPVSYPGAVSPDLGEPLETFFLSAFLFKTATSFRVRRRDSIKCRLIKLITLLVVSHDKSLSRKRSGLNLSRFYNYYIDSLIVNFLWSFFTYQALKTSWIHYLLSKMSFIQILCKTFRENFWRWFWNIQFSGTTDFFKWKK